MKTKVILIISKSLMQFGHGGLIHGQSQSPEIDPLTFDAKSIPAYCIADMEQLMFLAPGSYAFEVYRNFGPCENGNRFFATRKN